MLCDSDSATVFSTGHETAMSLTTADVRRGWSGDLGNGTNNFYREGGFEAKPKFMNSQTPLEDLGGKPVNVCTDDVPCADPQAVNKLLSHELNQLSQRDREQISEEIHGVKPGVVVPQQSSTSTSMQLSREEQEQIIFREFQDELDRYYFSESPPLEETDLFGNNHRHSTSVEYKYPAYRYARENGSELIHDRDFQLSFFGQGEAGSCPKKAANRMMNYLEFVRKVYHTDDVLFRPITLSDLDQAIGAKDLMYEIAPLQILPLRDPSGRRVFVHLRDLGRSSYPTTVWVSGRRLMVSFR